jgi:cytochrome P450
MNKDKENSPAEFTPPYPCPHKTKSGLILRFIRGWNSWIHILFERSYSMKMGQAKLPKFQLFMVNESSLVKKILRTEWSKFPKHWIITEMMRPLLGESIFTTNGETWKRQREMMDGAFAHTHLKKVFPLMKQAADEMLRRFRKYNENDAVDVDMEMTHVTADIIFRTILSHSLGEEEAKKIFEAFTDFQETVQRCTMLKLYGLPDFNKKKKSQKQAAVIRDILSPIIRKRYDDYISGRDTENIDILSSLMQARDKTTGDAFDFDELVDHVCMLFLAGHETSASALTWSLYLIANCPHIADKMLKEINETAGDQELDFENIKNLNFTKDVFRESLRLYPPVGSFMREASENQCMRDKDVKKGDMIVIAPWLIHRHRKQWQKPDVFKPERFSDKSAEAQESIKCSYIPFGDGPRICIGAGFATQEAILILASVVKDYSIANKPGHVPEPVGRVTIRPKNGVKLLFKKR